MSQFCRLCGTDLRAVRAGMERPDLAADSATTARTEIGRAIAAKIRELDSGDELKRVAEDVLPQVEKFLESPAEKRLRRMRTGVITAASGLGAAFMFLLVGVATGQEELIVAIGAGLVVFLVGLGLIINGKLLTVQKSEPQDKESLPQDILDQLSTGATPTQRGLRQGAKLPPSVVEHTTHRLPNELAGIHSPAKDEG
ncbi:MAG: hypothetical protein M3362_06775 [Acidobacteriota bacterium]|nr:hypothetical protein [Acidobacteriota bacterium]